MEEDIKILEDKLKLNATTKFDWFGEKEFKAIENLISRNKELEVITNGIKVLETNGVNDNIFYVIAKTDFLKGSYKYLLDDYIPKSVIEELLKNVDNTEFEKNGKSIYLYNRLQELLEE